MSHKSIYIQCCKFDGKSSYEMLLSLNQRIQCSLLEFVFDLERGLLKNRNNLTRFEICRIALSSSTRTIKDGFGK